MVHAFTQKGVNLVLDTESEAVHILDDTAYRLVKNLKPPLSETCPGSLLNIMTDKYDVDDVKSAYSDLYGLYKDNMLFCEEVKAAAYNDGARIPVKALCLHVSHDCNLRCEYCFASTGDFGTGRKIMSFETARRAIDYVIENSGSRKNIEIDFFGGEPLMAFDTVVKTVNYARKMGEKTHKNFHFTITTNGMLLDDEKINFINSDMDNVVLSLDGRKNINDGMRKTVTGKGSYDIITPKMKRLVDKRDKEKDYYVRGTFTSKNLDFTEDVNSIFEAGFEHVSVEPVITDESRDYAIKKQDLPEIFEEYEKLCEMLLDRETQGLNFDFFHFNIDFENPPCAVKRMRGCGAGSEYLAVTPDGALYPCHQFAGDEKFKVGTLDTGLTNNSVIDIFKSKSVSTMPECKNCWAKYFCSGGCSAANYHINGNINKPYEIGCELQKKRLECALYIKAKQYLNNR